MRYQASIPVKGGTKLVYWWNWGTRLCTSRMRLVLDCASRMRYQAGGVPVKGGTCLVCWWNWGTVYQWNWGTRLVHQKKEVPGLCISGCQQRYLWTCWLSLQRGGMLRIQTFQHKLWTGSNCKELKMFLICLYFVKAADFFWYSF